MISDFVCEGKCVYAMACIIVRFVSGGVGHSKRPERGKPQKAMYNFYAPRTRSGITFITCAHTCMDTHEYKSSFFLFQQKMSLIA